jgi:O-antigen ligase
MNIILLIFIFPFIHVWSGVWFNNLWKSLIVIWVLKKLMDREKILDSIPPSGILLSVFVFTVLLSTFLSEQLSVSLRSISYYLRGIGLCIVLYDFSLSDDKRIQRVLVYIMGSAGIVAVDAIFQVLFKKDLMGTPLMQSRASAFFSHPFYVSLWTGIGLFAVAPIWANSTKRTHKLVLTIAISFFLFAFLFSKTRAAWVAIAMTSMIIFFHLPQKKKLLKAIFLIGVVALVFILDDSLRERALSIVKEENLRMTIWKQSFTLIEDKFSLKEWVIGRGPGMFKVEYPPYDLIQEGAQFPHLILLELFYAAGFIGVGAFLLWFTCCLFKLLSCVSKKPAEHLLMYVGLIPLLILLMCFISESLFSRYFSFPFWFFIGLSLSLLSSAVKNQSREMVENNYEN